MIKSRLCRLLSSQFHLLHVSTTNHLLSPKPLPPPPVIRPKYDVVRFFSTTPDQQNGNVDKKEEEEEKGYKFGDYLRKMLEKREKEKRKYGDYGIDEPTYSDSDEDDELWGKEAHQKRVDLFEKKFKRHEELMEKFTNAKTLDEACKWMKRIDTFEKKHLKPRLEYKVIAELIDRMKVATGKDKFLLQHKLNRAMRLVEWREAYDPNNPANYGLIQKEHAGAHAEEEDANDEEETRHLMKKGVDNDNDEDMEFDDMKERDDILLEKLAGIDKQLEKKLADLDHVFGKKGKLLEEEIRNLAQERNTLIEEKRKPLYRKGFDVKLINVNRTCKVTKGGQVIKYSALLACGNYHGVIGYAKAKAPAVPIAIQKAQVKCFQNLHYVERHEEHTIAHAIQTSYKKTKLYLWPGKTQTGMKAGKHVQTILNLAGFKNVKSKVVGSRNPYNTVKVVFKALNAIETPKDVQEKFGRTVVESYLL